MLQGRALRVHPCNKRKNAVRAAGASIPMDKKMVVELRIRHSLKKLYPFPIKRDRKVKSRPFINRGIKADSAFMLLYY